MDNVTYSDVNIVPVFSQWTLSGGAYIDVDKLVMVPGSIANVRISSGEGIYPAANMKAIVNFTATLSGIDRYRPNGFVSLKLKYKDKGSQYFKLLFNDNSEVETGVYQDTTLLESLRIELDYIDIEVKLDSNADSSIQIRSIEIYKSMDTPIERITEVIKYEAVAIDVAYINNIQANSMTVEYVETNFDAIDPNKEYVPYRTYLRIYNNVIEYWLDHISESELEDYKTVDGQQYYWSEIGSGEDAYKYRTLTDPVKVYEYRNNTTLSEIERADLREQFKVKVRKATIRSLKKVDTWAKKNGVDIPITIWGVGNGVEVPSYLQEFDGITLYRTQTVTYKDIDGYYEKFFTSSGGVVTRVLKESNQLLEFRPNGFVFRVGELTSTWKFTESGGELVSLYNPESGATIPVVHGTIPIP